MIKETKALSTIEAMDLLESIDVDDDKKKEIKGFFKKFIKVDGKEAKKLREELENLEIIKIKTEHIVKIIDILPENSSELNKIFVDVSLNEDETNKILEIIKKFK